MAAEVNGSRRDVDVHEVIHYTTLNVILNPVHEVPGSHIEDLNVGKMTIKQMDRQREEINERGENKSSKTLLFYLN